MGWTESGQAWGERAADWAYLAEPYARRANDARFDRAGVGPGTRLFDIACGSDATRRRRRACRLGVRLGHRARPRRLTPDVIMRLSAREGWHMADDDYPEPQSGFVVTHFLVVSDQDRSREFYRTVFGAKVILDRDPVIMKLANSWLILNVGGGPTDDKPTVTLRPPSDPDHASAFINLRVADIAAAYAEWSAKGAEFLTEPKDHGREIRAYIRDPDGHLIEVGQTTMRPGPR